MQDLKDKNIILALSSSIAVYKSADLISILRKQGANVKVIMTENAAKLISPLILQTLSCNKVYVSMWEKTQDWQVEHISLADWADIFLVCPCSANTLANIANGFAPDFLSTCFLATRAKSYLALAMNDNMYANKAVQINIEKARNLGIQIIEPESGKLACGRNGKGKLASLENIVGAISKL